MYIRPKLPFRAHFVTVLTTYCFILPCGLLPPPPSPSYGNGNPFSGGVLPYTDKVIDNVGLVLELPGNGNSLRYKSVEVGHGQGDLDKTFFILTREMVGVHCRGWRGDGELGTQACNFDMHAGVTWSSDFSVPFSDQLIRVFFV